MVCIISRKMWVYVKIAAGMSVHVNFLGAKIIIVSRIVNTINLQDWSKHEIDINFHNDFGNILSPSTAAVPSRQII